MSEYDERDEQIWAEAPPRDGVDQYARESDPFYRPTPTTGSTATEPRAATTELLDAVEALLTSEPKSYWLRGPVVRRLREAYNALVALAAASPSVTEPEPMTEHLRALHDAYYAIPAGTPTAEQVLDRLPALYAAIEAVLEDANRIGGLIATVDDAEKQGLTIHVATRPTCAEHIEAGDD